MNNKQYYGTYDIMVLWYLPPVLYELYKVVSFIKFLWDATYVMTIFVVTLCGQTLIVSTFVDKTAFLRPMQSHIWPIAFCHYILANLKYCTCEYVVIMYVRIH